jgi:ArsR family transcriptional regulator
MRDLPRLFAKDPVTRDRAAELAAVARAVADPSRVEILSLLIAHPGMTVTDVIAALNRLAQPTVSHHLRLLREAGLVTSAKDGVFVRYTVRWTSFRQLSDALFPGNAR